MSSKADLVYAETEKAYALWVLRMEEVILFIRKIGAEADLVTTVAQLNMLGIDSCDCSDKHKHKPGPQYVKRANADLEKSLEAFTSRWEQAEEQFAALLDAHLKTLTDGDTLLKDVSLEMAIDAREAVDKVRMENGMETRKRLRSMIDSVQDIGKYALETEMRGIAFDCSDEILRVAFELEKELGYTWRKINAKEYIFNIPIIVNAYIRKVKEIEEALSKAKPESKPKCSGSKK
ncbi:hypothetical protein PMAYCL1PPCAC_04572 [Pristionchus mayeri]|uniref:Uncharacterized protein n=1 Tax=Pristionchus mayeri TaxID=1317129 RepID=A0AAN4ZAS4_9BILA|nr:hypothetical protein PMAYCL1PPCAC_04572 [Pristionchus mayeri]